jgi:hypothetical protein
MDCRIVCFDSVGFIHYQSPEELLNINNCKKMQQDYKDIWALILPYLIESENINKELLLKNNTINNSTGDIWLHQMGFLDDLLVCVIFNQNKRNEQELKCIENIRNYSILMQKLTQYTIHFKNIPINNTHQLNQLFNSLNNDTIPVSSITDNKDDYIENLKVQLVDLMLTCVETWQTSTGDSSLELAEKSGFWLVSIEDGQLRTRTMNKYSDINKIPNNPRWRQVVKTAHFILSNCELNSKERSQLNNKVNSVKQLIKNRAIGL